MPTAWFAAAGFTLLLMLYGLWRAPSWPALGAYTAAWIIAFVFVLQ